MDGIDGWLEDRTGSDQAHRERQGGGGHRRGAYSAENGGEVECTAIVGRDVDPAMQRHPRRSIGSRNHQTRKHAKSCHFLHSGHSARFGTLFRASSVMLRTARLWGTGRLVPVLTRQSHPWLHHSAVTRSLLWPTPRAAAAAAARGPRLAVLRATGFPRRTLAMGGNRFVKVVPSTMNPWLRRAL